MKTNSISHKDVIDRFVSYGESNFETTSVNNYSDVRSKEQLGVLRLIYAYRFSGHLRAKLDPLNRPSTRNLNFDFACVATSEPAAEPCEIPGPLHPCSGQTLINSP